MTDDISKVVREMREQAQHGPTVDWRPNVFHFADRIEKALESATTPAEVGKRHVRHEGGGVIALYEGDQRIREIGVAFTVGWDHRDRDEFIVRYNEHATLARQLAEAKAETVRVREVYEIVAGSVSAALARAGVTDCDDPGEAIDVMREKAERRLGEVEGLVSGALTIQQMHYGDGMGTHLALIGWARDAKAALTKEPTK